MLIWPVTERKQIFIQQLPSLVIDAWFSREPSVKEYNHHVRLCACSTALHFWVSLTYLAVTSELMRATFSRQWAWVKECVYWIAAGWTVRGSKPILVAARSGIAGSNPAGGYGCLCAVCCTVRTKKKTKKREQSGQRSTDKIQRTKKSRWGEKFPAPVQTGPGAHPVSYTMGTDSLSWVSSGRGVALTTHHHLVSRLKKE